MLLALHNLYPSLRPYTQPFFELSYYDAATNAYVQGWDDAYFVISAALALTAIRAIAIEWILQPLARQAGLKRKGAVRLAEQGWQALYYGFIWGVGLVRAFRETLPGTWMANLPRALYRFCGRTLTTGSISALFGTSGPLARSPVL